MRKVMLVVGVALGIATPAAAQFVSKENLAAVRSVIVSVDASEREGSTTCLPSDEQLRAEAELALRRAGVRVLDESQSYNAADLLALLRRAYPAGWEAVPAERRTEYQTAMLNRPHYLSVGVVALQLGGGPVCAISYTYRLWRLEPLDAGLGMGPFGLVLPFSAGGVVTGGLTQAAGQLRETTNAEVTRLANEILSARR